MNPEEILLARKEFLFPADLHLFEKPLVVERGKGCYLYDTEGREYLDFFAGIVVVSVGHGNEEVNGKLKAQMDKLSHSSTMLATGPPVELARSIAGLTPGGALTKSFFSNSGTEANEMAVLAARCATGSSEVVALRHGYHGRSALAMGLTGQSVWRMGPQMTPGFTFAQNAYCYRCPYGMTYPACDIRCAADVEDTIRTTTSGRIAGFIAEPIQGTAGFITPPPEYFPRVAEIVRRYGGLFISDEVQTGWGRTGGRWFGIEQWGVTPDILTGAKGLGNGFPIGLTVTSPEVAEKVGKMTISTFGGSPLAATAAKAVIDFIDENRLLENAEKAGAHLRGRLEELQQKHATIGDVRGMGLMQAIELVRDRATKEPAVTEAARLMELAREERILCGKGGMQGTCLRITPPLNVGVAEIDEFIARLDRALGRLEKSC
jgi:4-aminobutyrate aminotransferase